MLALRAFRIIQEGLLCVPLETSIEFVARFKSNSAIEVFTERLSISLLMHALFQFRTPRSKNEVTKYIQPIR